MAAVFVHVSDIHFGQEKNSGQVVVHEDARAQLIEDAAHVVAGLSNKKASGIIVTGDIAFAAKSQEYEAAGTWLDGLAARIGCAAADIQMVPGNHDIDLDKVKGAVELVLAEIHDKGEAKLDSFLDVDSDRELLYGRFAEYRRFADAYQCPLDCTGASSADRRIELVNERSIRFVRLNSALICTRGVNEKGKLLLGARQRVMRETVGEELVVLTHHPLDWYADSIDARRFLRARARVFISGHEHIASMEVQNVEEGRDLMMLAAGAATPSDIDETFNYAYNVIEFDWDPKVDALVVALHARAWNDEMKRFEADGDLDQRIVLGSPNFRKNLKPSSLCLPAEIDDNRPAQVEIIMPPQNDMRADVRVDDSEYQNLYLRFFRDLGEGDRLRILVELNAVPSDIAGGFNHHAESRLFKSVFRANRVLELREKIEDALAVQEQRRAE